MAIISCPCCDTKLSVRDEFLGKKVKCPKCGTVISVTVPPPTTSAPPVPTLSAGRLVDSTLAAPAEAIARGPGPWSSEPVPPSDLESDREANDSEPIDPRLWGTAKTGLQLVSAGSLIILFSSIVIQVIALSVALSAGPRRAGGPAMANDFSMLAAAMGCGSLFGVVLCFIGMCLTCTAPDPRAAGRARISVLCLAGAILIGLGVAAFVIIFAAEIRGQRQPGALDQFLAVGIVALITLGLVVVFTIVGMVFWLLFHVAVGEHFRDSGLVRAAYAYLIGAFCLIVLSFIVHFVITFTFRFSSPQFGAIANSIVSIVYALVQIIWYLNLCQKTLALLKVHVANGGHSVKP